MPCSIRPTNKPSNTRRATLRRLESSDAFDCFRKSLRIFGNKLPESNDSSLSLAEAAVLRPAIKVLIRASNSRCFLICACSSRIAAFNSLLLRSWFTFVSIVRNVSQALEARGQIEIKLVRFHVLIRLFKCSCLIEELFPRCVYKALVARPLAGLYCLQLHPLNCCRSNRDRRPFVSTIKRLNAMNDACFH